jgi:hypothetical protein
MPDLASNVLDHRDNPGVEMLAKGGRCLYRPADRCSSLMTEFVHGAT